MAETNFSMARIPRVQKSGRQLEFIGSSTTERTNMLGKKRDSFGVYWHRRKKVMIPDFFNFILNCKNSENGRDMHLLNV